MELWYSHVVNGNSYYDWPVVSVLFKPAFYFWMFVYLCMVVLFKKSRKGISVFAYPLLYFMTMFLGPCVNFRYIYPFIVVLPILTAFILSEKESSRDVVKQEIGVVSEK